MKKDLIRINELAAGRKFLAIRNGVRGTAMPSWPMLSDRQNWQLLAYITSRSIQ